MVAQNRHYSRYFHILSRQVKLLESMRKMDETSYQAYFGGERMWTTILSDQRQVPVKKRILSKESDKKQSHSDPDSDSSSSTGQQSDDELTTTLVTYDDRLLYASLVERTRMNESKLQVFCHNAYDLNVQQTLFILEIHLHPIYY